MPKHYNIFYACTCIVFHCLQDIYASLITGHAQNGDMDKAEDVMRLMKDKGHPLSNVTYQAVLCAYAKEGNIKAIARVRVTGAL